MTETINGLPLFRAEIESDLEGVLCVSLVDCPAVEINFVAFDAKLPNQRFSVANEEKRLIRGVLMRANYPIYRNDPSMGEYYIVFSAQVIRKIIEKYLLEQRSSNVNLMHLANSNVEGVDLVQIFFKDTASGLSPVGFEEVEDGSAFGEYHVKNDEVWYAIKNGTFRGFSIEGLFSFKPVEKHLNQKDMNIKEKFRNVLVRMRVVTTDKAILVWDGEEDLKQGDKVYVEEEGEERKPAPDGDYKTEDGKIIKVANGVVTEIVDPEAEVAPEEMDDTPDPDEKDPGTREDEDELWARVNNLKEEIESLKKEVDAMRGRQTEMSNQVEKLAKSPAGKQAHEEFDERKGDDANGSAELNRMKRIAGATRK